MCQKWCTFCAVARGDADKQHFGDFRIPELIALSEMIGLPRSFYDPATCALHHPLVECMLDSDATAVRLIERSVMVKQIFHVWGQAATLDDLLTVMQGIPEAQYVRFAREGGEANV